MYAAKHISCTENRHLVKILVLIYFFKNHRIKFIQKKLKSNHTRYIKFQITKKSSKLVHLEKKEVSHKNREIAMKRLIRCLPVPVILG